MIFCTKLYNTQIRYSNVHVGVQLILCYHLTENMTWQTMLELKLYEVCMHVCYEYIFQVEILALNDYIFVLYSD